MPPYSFTYNFDIGDNVYDLLTYKECIITGVSYMNGKTPFNEKVYFHSVAYFIQFKDDSCDVRYEESLERVRK